MRCDDVGERLQLRLDDELHPQAEWQLERHLESCPRCREHHHELSALSALLAEVAVTERLEPAPRRDAADGRVGWLSSAAAAVLIAAGFALAEHRWAPPPAETAERPVVAPTAVASVELRKAGLMAIDLPSRNEDVHIVWLYPSRTAESRKGT